MRGSYEDWQQARMPGPGIAYWTSDGRTAWTLGGEVEPELDKMSKRERLIFRACLQHALDALDDADLGLTALLRTAGQEPS